MKPPQLLACATLLSLSLVSGSPLIAGTVQGTRIFDGAKVFTPEDRAYIAKAARYARFPIAIWTVTGGYSNNETKFNSEADHRVPVGGAVIAIDVGDRLSHFADVKSTGLTTEDARNALIEAARRFHVEDWTGGVVAVIHSPRAGYFSEESC